MAPAMDLAIVLLALALVIAVGPAAAPCAAATDGPLTLDECTRIALTSNPQITASAQGVISARAGLVRALSSYYPQVSISAEDSVSGVADETERWQNAEVALRQTLWRMGRKENIDQTKASLTATEMGHTAALHGLVEQVAGDYYGALAARQLLEVAEAAVDSGRRHLEEVEARIALGATAEVEVFPAQDDLARAELELVDARSSVRLGLARLKNTMGVPPETDLELADAPAPGEEMVPSLADALQAARDTRPEVLAAKASLRASGKGLRQAEISQGPVADLTGQHNWGYTDWEARDPSWDVRLGVSWALFDGWSTRADLVSARAGLKRAEADLQRTLNQVGLEVETAIAEVERGREGIAASGKSVAAAEARLRAAEGKYQQGVGILIEVIDARVAVTNAHASQVRARYDYQVALVGLDRATGRLSVPGTGEG